MRWQCFASSVVTGLVGAASIAAQSTLRVSVSSSGAEGNRESRGPSISADGRYVAFDSLAKTLVAGDTNQRWDVFVHDRQMGQTLRVSVDSSGAQSNGHSGSPALSADGRVVAFQSAATNLVAGDTNGFDDIYVKDLASGSITRVSVATLGWQADADVLHPALSGDGRYVVFASTANTLANAGYDSSSDIYMHDRATAQTTCISNWGVPSNGHDSDWPVITPDGRFVAFQSLNSWLVANDTNGLIDVFVYELATALFSRVSVSASGTQGNAHSLFPSLSTDARFVAFESDASNLVPNDANGKRDVFVCDRVNGTIEAASVTASGFPSIGWSSGASLSGDGHYVLFESDSNDLVAQDFNGVGDTFLRDLLTHSTTRVSVDATGAESNGWSVLSRISADGRTVAFESLGSQLVPNDTNDDWDVFVRAPVSCDAIAYCTAGTSAHGCVPSISASGAPSTTAGAGFTITVHGVEGQKAGILFYGVNGREDLPWASGSSSFLCVALPTQRMSVQSSGGTLGQCNGVLSEDWNAFVATHPAALGQPFAVGQIVDAQAWFRDPPSPKSTSLSDALDFVVCP